MSNDQSLDSAPEEIKLAVDLIYLLESNDISPEIALKALDIVQSDLRRQLESSKQQAVSSKQ